MYTLRVIEETRENEKAPFECVVVNHSLGNSYAFFDPGTKRFKEECQEEFRDEFYGVVMSEGGMSFWLKRNRPNNRNSYYIMTESGKTFEKL